jgi:hypothetical protein
LKKKGQPGKLVLGLTCGSSYPNAQDSAGDNGSGPHPLPPGETDEGSDVNTENLLTGYVALYRSILEHPLFTQHPPEYLKIWVYMLLRAARKPKRWWDGTAEVSIPVGGFVGSLNTISKRCGVSRSQVQRALVVFAKCDMIDCVPRHNNSLYVVNNYASYQEKKTATDTPAERQRYMSDTPSERDRNVSGTNQEEIGKRREETNTDTPPPAAGLREQLFDEFWSIVWAKIGVGAARKAWKAKVKGSKQARRVIEAAKQQGPGILQKAADNGIGVLHPATWLNQERYEDETRPLVAAPPEIVWTPEAIAEADRRNDEQMAELARRARERRLAAQEARRA